LRAQFLYDEKAAPAQLFSELAPKIAGLTRKEVDAACVEAFAKQRVYYDDVRGEQRRGRTG